MSGMSELSRGDNITDCQSVVRSSLIYRPHHPRAGSQQTMPNVCVSQSSVPQCLTVLHYNLQSTVLTQINLDVKCLPGSIKGKIAGGN